MGVSEQLLYIAVRFVAGMVIPLLILTVAKRYRFQFRHPAIVYGTCALFAVAIPFVGVSAYGKIVLSAYASLFGLVCIFWGFARTSREITIRNKKKRKPL